MDVAFWKKRKSFSLEDSLCVRGEKFLFKENKKLTVNGKEIEEEVIYHAFLRLDPEGHIIYWTLEEKSTAFYYLFIDELVDVRILNNRESKKRSDGLITLQFVPNKDYTHFEIISFLHPSSEIVKEWAEILFSWVYKQKKSYHNQLHYVKKLATPRIYGGTRILFNQYNQSVLRENKVIDTLFGTKLKDFAGRNVSLTDSEAVELYLNIVNRSEIKQIFQIWSSKDDCMTVENFKNFLNKSQRDPRLNEDLYLPKTFTQALKIIKKLENGKEELSYIGFVKYLLSEENTDLSTSAMALKPELMGNPISHYYINSSHNSYLIGNQIILAKFLPDNNEQECRTDAEMYRQILLSGCRCVELDVWESAEGPVITHGPISIQKINTVPLEEVCEAIIETAFKTTDYPVVLSIENHCKGEQQRKMSEIFKKVFGDYLLKDPLEDYPLLGNQNGYLPPPIALKNKILLKGSRGDFGKIKNVSDIKKRHTLKEHLPSTITVTVEKIKDTTTTIISEKHDNDLVNINKTNKRLDKLTKQHRRKLLQLNQSVSIQETESSLKDLINYFQTTPKIHNDDPYFWMHSGNEEKIDKDIQKCSNNVIKHTIRHIIRVYPDHKRIDSDNFFPTFFWTGGCQMIAMNFQTNGVAMELNDALFEENGRCGYVPKPDIMCIPGTKLSVYDSNFLVSNKVEISIISSQCLSLLAPGIKLTQVIIDLYDLPKDTVRSKHKTQPAMNKGMNTVYPKNNLIFQKIIKPQHAMLYFRVVEVIIDDDNNNKTKNIKEERIQRTIGHRILPVHHLTQGYRHITLRTSGNKPLGPASIFVKINVQTYVPESQVAIRRQLTEPIQVKVEAEMSKSGFADPLQARKNSMNSLSSEPNNNNNITIDSIIEGQNDEVYV